MGHIPLDLPPPADPSHTTPTTAIGPPQAATPATRASHGTP